MSEELQFTIEARQMFDTETHKPVGFAVFCCKSGMANHPALPFGYDEFSPRNFRMFDTADKALEAYDKAGQYVTSNGAAITTAYPQQRKYQP